MTTEAEISGVTPEMLGVPDDENSPEYKAKMFNIAFRLGGLSEQVNQLGKIMQRTNDDLRRDIAEMAADRKARAEALPVADQKAIANIVVNGVRAERLATWEEVTNGVIICVAVFGFTWGGIELGSFIWSKWPFWPFA